MYAKSKENRTHVQRSSLIPYFRWASAEHGHPSGTAELQVTVLCNPQAIITTSVYIFQIHFYPLPAVGEWNDFRREQYRSFFTSTSTDRGLTAPVPLRFCKLELASLFGIRWAMLHTRSFSSRLLLLFSETLVMTSLSSRRMPRDRVCYCSTRSSSKPAYHITMYHLAWMHLNMHMTRKFIDFWKDHALCILVVLHGHQQRKMILQFLCKARTRTMAF